MRREEMRRGKKTANLKRSEKIVVLSEFVMARLRRGKKMIRPRNEKIVWFKYS